MDSTPTMALDFIELSKKLNSFIIFVGAILLTGYLSSVASNLSDDMKHSIGYIWNGGILLLLYVISGKAGFALSK